MPGQRGGSGGGEGPCAGRGLLPRNGEAAPRGDAYRKRGRRDRGNGPLSRADREIPKADGSVQGTNITGQFIIPDQTGEDSKARRKNSSFFH